MTDREAIARIINPEAWGSIDRATRMRADVKRNSMRDWNEDNYQRRTKMWSADSLAKADAILAYLAKTAEEA